MKKIKLNIAVLLFSSFVLLNFLACDKSDDVKVDAIFPLALGNQWVYLDSTSGYGYGQGDWDIRIDTMKIVYKSSIEGHEGFSNELPNDNDYIQLVNIDNSGNAIQVGAILGDSRMFLQSMALKNYPSVGEKWSYVSLYYSANNGFKTDTTYYTCEGINVPVTTSLGSFKCNKYRVAHSGIYDTDSEYSISYYARGIGQIRYLFYYNDKVEYSSTLLSYKLY